VNHNICWPLTICIGCVGVKHWPDQNASFSFLYDAVILNCCDVRLPRTCLKVCLRPVQGGIDEVGHTCRAAAARHRIAVELALEKNGFASVSHAQARQAVAVASNGCR
jgi:hypothetical protein